MDKTSMHGVSNIKPNHLLGSFPFWITYDPLPDEVRFAEFVSLPQSDAYYQIAPAARLDPSAEALTALRIANARDACVLLPGRAFDRHGTRWGRGSGWYDRFLSVVPASWTRIGFCHQEDLSDVPLLRQSWDESVDIVCVQDDGRINVIETNARTSASAYERILVYKEHGP